MKHLATFLILTMALLVSNNQVFAQNNYFQYGNLNSSSVTVSNTWTKLGTGTYSFTKNQTDTEIEVIVNTRFQVGYGMTKGVEFTVMIDDVIEPDYGNYASIKAINSSTFQSIFAVFEDISAGTHTVSLWAKAAPSGYCDDVLVDPGGWGGKIILKIIGDLSVSVPEPPVVQEDQVVKQNYPNPFYPETTIDFNVQQPAHVELKIYNSSGQMIRKLIDEFKSIGEYSVLWDGKDKSGQIVSVGNYYYQITIGKFVSTKKMILVH